MLEININNRSRVPLYLQIVEQVKQQIAGNRFKPGERLPTVRDLSRRLRVNPATVARAYQELEQAGIIGASRRRGTIVMGEAESPQRAALRQSRLASMVNELIMDLLSQGYSPEEIEAAFTLQLARWRVQREMIYQPAEKQGEPPEKQLIRIVGSHDIALELLVNRLKYKNPGIEVQLTCAGSLGGLLAIQEGKADLAGIHLLDEETGEYNYPYVKHILQNIAVVVIHLADRIQGLMVAKGNPKRIQGLEDLARSDIVFVNRQKGSGTRVWLDYRLRELGILPSAICGYSRELDTHLAVGTCIARGEADAGMGIQAAAISCNLDFIPLTSEKFDLIIPEERYHSPIFASLMEIIESEEFKRVVKEMGGYDTSHTGETVLIGNH